MVMGDFHNHPFGILTTQLQGEDDPHYTTENADIRRDQMLQIQSELLAPFAKAHPNVPVFLCGDFGTAHLDDSHPPRETAAYLSMINLFGVLNGPGTRITLNDNSWCNELASDDTGRTAELDYIFVPRNDPHLMVDWNLVVMRSGNWDGPGGRHDLSYKYGVAATIKFK